MNRINKLEKLCYFRFVFLIVWCKKKTVFSGSEWTVDGPGELLVVKLTEIVTEIPCSLQSRLRLNNKLQRIENRGTFEALVSKQSKPKATLEVSQIPAKRPSAVDNDS